MMHADGEAERKKKSGQCLILSPFFMIVGEPVVPHTVYMHAF